MNGYIKHFSMYKPDIMKEVILLTRHFLSVLNEVSIYDEK